MADNTRVSRCRDLVKRMNESKSSGIAWQLVAQAGKGDAHTVAYTAHAISNHAKDSAKLGPAYDADLAKQVG